jgi:peptidyl-prolyl cis-trans isomerase D
MLQALRDKSSGWIATVILGLLIVPFAFFGVEQYLVQRNDTFAARIQSPPAWWPGAPDWWVLRKLVWQTDDIAPDEFRERFEQARQQQRAAEGDAFDPRAFESLETKERILDALIDQRVMRMAAQRDGLVVGDTQLREAIEAIPDFQVDGKFDAQRYRMLLTTLNPPQTPLQFQQTLRDSLRDRLLATRLAESAFVTPSEGQRLITLLGEKRDVTFAFLPTPAADAAPVTAAEIAAWYKAHPSDFRTPEQVTIEYVDVDAAALPPPPAADLKALQARYEQDKARFVEPEQRLTSHILIKVDAKADAAAQKAAEAKARDLLKQLRAGADFATLARQNSEDASRDAGGDLGWIQKNGQMVKPFEDAVFATAAGSISEPVKTEFGWHLVQVREIKPSHGKSFEEARPELERLVAESERERAYNDLAGRLSDEVLKNPNSLASVAKTVNLSVQKLGPFARGQGTGVAANPAVQRFVFSDEAKERRQSSDPIEIAPNHSVLVRVVEHTPEQVQPLDKVGARVVAAVRADRASKAAEAEAEAALARLKKGETLVAVATEKQWQVTPVPGLPRGAPAPDAQANAAYFAVPPPAADKPSVGKVRAADGRWIVFAVTGIGHADENEIKPEQRVGFLRAHASRTGDEDAIATGKAERKRMKIEKALDRL